MPPSVAHCILFLEASHTGKLIITGQCPENETEVYKSTWVVLKKSFSTRVPETLSLATLANLNLLDIINPSESLSETMDTLL